MDYKAICGVASAALTIAGFITYLWWMKKTGERPSRATWLIWTLNSFLLPASYYMLGVKQTLWLAVSYAIGCTAVAVYAVLMKGEREFTRIERWCFFGVGVAAFLWFITGLPLVAFVLALVIDLIGITSTMEHAWKRPQGESLVAWNLMCAGGVFSIFAVEIWSWEVHTFIDASYPVQISVTTAVIMAILYIRRRALL